jgi:hypothetical protein
MFEGVEKMNMTASFGNGLPQSALSKHLEKLRMLRAQTIEVAKDVGRGGVDAASVVAPNTRRTMQQIFESD